MADTRRSLSDLKSNLFADGQAAGSITPQDVRDLITTFTPPAGRMYVSTAAATTISAGGTYVKLAGTSTSDGLSEFTMPADNRLTYTGVVPVTAFISVAASFTSSESNEIMAIAVAKNGTVETPSIIRHKIGTGSDLQAVTLFDTIQMDTNDYVEPHVTLTGATGTITAGNLYMRVVGFPA